MPSLLSDDCQVNLPGPYPSTPAHLHQCQPPSSLPLSILSLCRALKGTQKQVTTEINLESCTTVYVIQSCGLINVPNVIPVSATRWGRQRRLASTISSIASRSGREQNRPVYRYSSTALIQLRVVLGNSTLQTGTRDTVMTSGPKHFADFILVLDLLARPKARGNFHFCIHMM